MEESGNNMKSNGKKLALYGLYLALGVVCMVLQRGILTTGFDSKGLLILENPRLYLLWILILAGIAAAAVAAWKLGKAERYADAFPACAVSGVTMIAAGGVMGFFGVNQLVPGGYVWGGLTIGAGVIMAVCGFFRMAGKKPPFVLDLLLTGFFVIHLLQSYSGWNAKAQVQRFALELLAGIAVMLYSLHRGRCAVDFVERRWVAFFGLTGMFLSIAACADGVSTGFYLACCLWCAGGMCALNRGPRSVRRSATP